MKLIMKKFVIIVAGGSGKRMGTEIPKQFLLLGEKPVLMHTIEKFYAYQSDIEIIVVLPDHQIEYWETIKNDYKFTIRHTVVSGGEERFFSVKNGLKAIDHHQGLVAVHDGVRPCVSNETIEQCYKLAENTGSAVPFNDLSESIRYVDGISHYVVNRNNYKTIQTPQIFDLSKLKKAYELPFKEEFTDDATVFENAGFKIHLVKGNKENIKITQPQDLEIAKLLLSRT